MKERSRSGRLVTAEVGTLLSNTDTNGVSGMATAVLDGSLANKVCADSGMGGSDSRDEGMCCIEDG